MKPAETIEIRTRHDGGDQTRLLSRERIHGNRPVRTDVRSLARPVVLSGVRLKTDHHTQCINAGGSE